MSKLYIIPSEPIENTYTAHWYTYFPKIIDEFATKYKKKLDIIIVDGEKNKDVNNTFYSNTAYTSSQLYAVASEFIEQFVSPNDQFLFTNAWNPTAISIKAMAEHSKIPIKLHGMWHAGSYDPNSYFSRQFSNKPWIEDTEKTLFECYDVNWFSTNFHINMFKNIFKSADICKIQRTGWPLDYLYKITEKYRRLPKKDIIVFPHKITDSTQLEIFKDLENSMPEYQWIVTSEKKLTSDEYFTLLGESKIIFSANLHDTFGINMIEGLNCQSAPLVPDRLCYSEMYMPQFKYPSEWTLSFEHYIQHKNLLMVRIRDLLSSVGMSAWRFGNIGLQDSKLFNYVYPTELLHNILDIKIKEQIHG